MGHTEEVKTTLEIPDGLFRKAKSFAAEHGIPLRALVSEALADKLRNSNTAKRSWMKDFGKLRHLHQETNRINRVLQEEFGKLEPEDWN